MASGANFDDYYKQVPQQSSEQGDNKAGGLKLKIKAKKATDTVSPVSVAPTPEVVESDGGQDVKKKASFTPTITFEAAPAIQPIKVEAKPVRTVSADEGTARPAREPASNTHPSSPKPAGFTYDPNKNFKVKKPQMPRISFEPAPKISVPPAQAAGGTVERTESGPNRLQAYAKTHQNAPKRGRNSLPSGKK